MSYQDIRDTREGFVRSDAGDNLMRIEARIIGVVAFFALWLAAGVGFFSSLIVGVLCCTLVPWLVGLVQAVAWVFSIIFSFFWAFIGYFIGGALLGDSPITGALVAIIVFIVCFFKHKVYAGLGYASVEKHVIDSVDDIRNNTANINNTIYSNSNERIEPVGIVYCTNCGEKIKTGARFCNRCGSEQ